VYKQNAGQHLDRRGFSRPLRADVAHDFAGSMENEISSTALTIRKSVENKSFIAPTSPSR